MSKAVHIHFWADIRNAAGSVEKVITAFAAHGRSWQQEILCCPGGRVDPAPYTYHGVRVTPFFENRLANRVFNKLLGLQVFTYPSLIRTLEQIRPDLLHFHNRQELVDQIIKRLSWRPAVAVHYHRHFRQPVRPDSADLLLFPSAATAGDILAKVGRETPWRVVANPLSLELLAHGAHAERPPRPPESAVFLFGGGGTPIKGGRELVAAFARLKYPGIRLVMAGRGVEHFSAPDPRVSLLGEIPADSFFRQMREADVVVMPSYNEPFGLIAQEAMLMRRLLVVSASGGLGEFTDASTGIQVQPESVDNLEAGLRQALAALGDRERHRRYLEAAYERIQSFHPDLVGANLERAYDTCLALAREKELM